MNFTIKNIDALAGQLAVGASATVWDGSDADNGYVDVILACPDVVAGPAKRYPKHCELVIVWEGKGQITIDDPAAGVFTLPLVPSDALVVPAGAARAFKSDPGTPLLLLLARHESATSQNAAIGASGPNPPDATRWIRNLGTPEYRVFDASVDRASRIRVWGKIPPVTADGKTRDRGKSDFHLNAYGFTAHNGQPQENPMHHHPNSVEWVLCLEGSAKMVVRTANDPDDLDAGWEKKSQAPAKTLQVGDTALVPRAAQHQYVGILPSNCLLLALQAPQPIMHLREAEEVRP
jgi:mannose-6-phosphate isomerase-like protein (cupin superfamily)